MEYNITVSNYDNSASWAKSLSEEDYSRVQGHINSATNDSCLYSILKGVVVPIRTSSWDHFNRDFFLPTVVNHAIKVENLIGRFFALIAALVSDIVTFPIRLLTCIPRVLTNAKREDHALHRYLSNQGDVDERLLAEDQLRIQVTWTTKEEEPSENKLIVTTYNDELEREIDLIDWPYYERMERTDRNQADRSERVKTY